MKVSIIVPVYNAEKYLEKCLESALSQTYTNVEIILIDDGSTDGSFSICSRYAESDNRIILLKQANQGVSVSRNRGIERSRGEYITFLDADDSMDSNAIATMVRLVEESHADIVRTRWREIKDGKIKISSVDIRSGYYSGPQLRKLLFDASTGKLKCFSFLLIMRKELLLSSGIRFHQGVTMMEDACFYADLFSIARSVYISNEVTHTYLLHSESASRSIVGFKDKIESIIKVNRYLRERESVTAQTKCIDAAHISIIANMLMVRLEDAQGMRHLSDMLGLIHNNKNARRLYERADLSYLGIYHQLEVWAVMSRIRLAVQVVRLIRKLAGR